MLNPKELESREKIEEKTGQKLQEVLIKDIFRTTNGYSGDDRGNLIGLNLNYQFISDISFLGDFPCLTHLNLAYNQITDLSPLQHLTHLIELGLGRNQITDLSPLRPLTNLTELYLWENQITDLSPLQHLTHLIELGLGCNQITDLSPLLQLTNLTGLYLWKNRITDLSPLKHLNNLTELHLYENQIADISPLLPLKKLNKLNVQYNKISRLSAKWAGRELEIKWEYDGSSGLFLKGNPLEFPPPEIVRRGTAAVRNYFNEIQKETVLLLQAKLLLVGAGAVGKTTLLKKLQDHTFNVVPGIESTTRGIDIVPWHLDCSFANGDFHPVHIHAWDFGGQDILYATHQFFLTKRSLYLFVWEARQEGQETASFDYWLNIIKLLGAGSPVLIVMNKADSRSREIDEASFRKKFPFIRAFTRVSCLTGLGITELTELLRSHLAQMPHLLERLPKSWLLIRDDLKKLKKDYISRSDYLAICKKRGLPPVRAEFLSDYLHDLGVILHFRGEPLLAETVILNPEWATSAVYKIIDAPAVAMDKGRFKYADLKTYWDPRTFPSDKHPQLLRLMEKFELCFPVVGSKDNIHIVPELLPAQQPVDLDPDKYRGPDSLHFEYHYDFMPRGILSRFISRLYSYIHKDHYWKLGVELVLENNYALVLSEPLNRKLTVSVSGPDQSELLAIARHHLEEIHRSLNMERDEHYREMIPCSCGPCRAVEKPFLFLHEDLKRFLDKGIRQIQCHKSGEQMLITGMLKGYALPAQTGLRELKSELLRTAVRLLGRAKAIKPDEDSRNTFIAEILSARGFLVKDQTRWGSTLSGKRPGELDFLVETPGGDAVSVMEAFILKGMNRDVIDTHFKKLFEYDAPGLDTNYIIVYVEKAGFDPLWQEYLKYLPEVKGKFPMKGVPSVENTSYADIKLARTVHLRHKRDTAVYHLFIKMI